MSYRCHALKQSLLRILIGLASESTLDLIVVRRICMSLAVLAVQMNESEIVSDILTNLNTLIAASPVAVLELLTVLPEECYNRQVIVENATRRQFAEQLRNSSPQVLQFLLGLISACSTGGVDSSSTLRIQKQILVCLDKWIDNAEIPLHAVLLPSGIFSYALSSLQHKELLTEATDVMTTVMRRYPHSPQGKDIALPSRVIQQIASLRSLWMSEISNGMPDDDICRSISCLFTECLDAYIELFISQGDFHQGDIFLQLLECAKYTDNFEVSRISLFAFYKLSLAIDDLRYQGATDLEKQSLTAQYSPLFLQFLVVTIQQLKLEASVLNGVSKIDEDDEDIRKEFSDSVRDVCIVVGSLKCVETACACIQEEIAKSGMSSVTALSTIEASLTVIDVVAPSLPDDEKVFVPQILELLRNLPPAPALLNTILKLFGSLSSWLNANGQYMTSLFEQILNALAIPELSTNASKALMKLCENSTCATDGSVSIPLDRLNAVVQQLRSSKNLSLENDLIIIDGISVLVSRLQPAQCTETLKALLQPIASSLHENLQRSAASEAISDVKRLAGFFRSIKVRRHSHDDNPVSIVFSFLWSLLAQVLAQDPSEQAAEKVCQCYKYVIRASGTNFERHITVMADHLATQFNQTPFSAFLYAGSICISEFGKRNLTDQTLQSVLMKMYVDMSSSFFQRYQSIEDFERAPDTAEEFLFLTAKVMEFFPEFILGPTVESQQRSRIYFQLALAGTRSSHRGIVRGSLTLFDKLISHLNTSSSGPVADKLRADVMSLLSESATPLIGNLAFVLSDPSLNHVVEENIDLIAKLFWNFRELSPSDLEVNFF